MVRTLYNKIQSIIQKLLEDHDPMKQLLLMRHGDALRGTPEMSDHARPLSEEGRIEVAQAGAWLRSAGKLPHGVLCSTALRTRQTVEALALPASVVARTIFSDQLYLASPGEILQCIQALPEAGDAILLVGHNPGIRDFCTMFAREGDPEAAEAMALGFKTAGIAGLTLPVASWKQAPGDAGGTVEFYHAP